jgi:hypothetical protein
MKHAFLRIVTSVARTALGDVLTAGQRIVHCAQLGSSEHVRG